jgi:cytochrome d ubiquinol oxidase subunit II
MDLNTTWFLLIGVLLAGYAVLDGFDLGVGVLHLFARGDTERRLHMNAIGPVWDGNEVWLIAGGGALFAAFPIAYATAFSGFYLAFMLLLFALIFRAVSLEFRGRVDSANWRRLWDWSFGLGSLLPAVLYGAAVGNVLRGLPITADGSLNMPFISILNPYALLVGVLSLAMFIMQGAAYMAVKTDGSLRQRMIRVMTGAWMALVVLYFLATLATYFVSPYLFEGLMGNPLFWIFLILVLAALAYFPVAARGPKLVRAFVASSTVIISMIGLAGISLFPRLLPSSLDLGYSLTVYNASSTPRTLTVMLIIALIGMPLVLGYTVFIYRVFRGKVVLAEDSY